MANEVPGDADHTLKRRMLGATVLIALAVIFLPLVFDGSGTESQFRSIEPMALEPPFDADVLAEDALPSITSPGSPVIEFVDEAESGTVQNDTSLSVPTASTTLPTDQPKNEPQPLQSQAVDDGIIPEAPAPEPVNPLPVQSDSADLSRWLVQVASFKDKINALSLRSELKQSGLPVDVEVGENHGQAVFRVFVGPLKGRQQAQQVAERLRKRLGREVLLRAK